MKSLSLYLPLVLCLFVVVFSWQCTEKYPAHDTNIVADADGCVGCHTNADLLKKVATPLPPASSEAGEG